MGGAEAIRTPKKARKTLEFLARNVSQSGCFGTVCPTWGNGTESSNPLRSAYRVLISGDTPFKTAK